MYDKILILGAGGCGKTTLGRKIGKILKIKSQSIDDLRYSKDFKITFSKEIANKNLKRLLVKKKWVLDGIYNEEYLISALKKATTIIVLKSSRLKLIFRILKREIGKKKHIFDLLKLIYWSQKYKAHNENEHTLLSSKYKKNVIVLKNEHEINGFLKLLKAK